MTIKEYLICKNKEIILKEFDLKKNTLTLDSKMPTLNQKVFWTCEHGHTWEMSFLSRIKGTGCPICSGRKVLKGYNDLLSKNPTIAEEWDYEKNIETPDNITYGSSKVVWWKCKYGHSWEDSVNHRFGGRGCPYCSNKKILVGINDLTTTNKEILHEWNYEKNTILPTEIVAGSNKKVWWKCKDCGTSWEASPLNKIRFNKKCPNCKNKKDDKNL